jgi:hypothetical protein
MASWPGNVAVAVSRGENTEVLLAENGDVLSRLVALHWVAYTPASTLGGHVGAIREGVRILSCPQCRP